RHPADGDAPPMGVLSEAHARDRRRRRSARARAVRVGALEPHVGRAAVDATDLALLVRASPPSALSSYPVGSALGRGGSFRAGGSIALTVLAAGARKAHARPLQDAHPSLAHTWLPRATWSVEWIRHRKEPACARSCVSPVPWPVPGRRSRRSRWRP